MKILVTGSSGFLGVEVVERLLEHGESDIRCFVRPGSRLEKLRALEERYPAAAIEYFTGNLTSARDAAEAIKGVRVVYHLAAAMAGSAADMFLNSVVASKNLLEAVSKRKTVKVVLVSSFGVYGVADRPAGSVVNERTPLETRPEERDVYSYSKWRQEVLFRDYQREYGFPLVILRPGVIYGPGGAPLSSRVGVNIFGLYFHFGRSNLLPLSYVTNCAEAIVVAGSNPEAEGEVYNVHDDDLPTAHAYLQAYRRSVRRMPYITIPYFVTQWISRAVKAYHSHSKGQLPDVFTPYKSASAWKGNTFDNAKVKSIGWGQLVSTREGMTRTFDHWHEAEPQARDA